MAVFQGIKNWATRIKRDSITLWFASRNPATPWLPKAICVFAVAYALSPIDLIPDFIPVLGYIDDALLLPALIWLAVRLLPPSIVAASRDQADVWLAQQGRTPRSYAGAALIIVVWVGIFTFSTCWFLRT